MKFICTKKCFYDGTLYIEGQFLNKDLKKAPAHFEKYTVEKVFPKDDEQAKTLSGLQKKDEVTEKLSLILKLNKDDLIVEAAAIGLSEGNDLTALTKVEIIDLVKKKLKGEDESVVESNVSKPEAGEDAEDETLTENPDIFE